MCRGFRDIHDFLTVSTEVGGVPGIWVTREGKQYRDAEGTLHESALEFKGGDYIGGTGTTAAMQSLWDAHSRDADDETHTDG